MGNGSVEQFASLRVQYSVEVDAFTGAATARIPIPTTPGRGLTPALALVHGGGGNSEIGLGWHLAGPPRIAIDRSEGVPRWDGTDGVALDGVPLVPWLDDGVARTRSEGDWQIAVLRPRHGFSAVAVERWRNAGTGAVHYRSHDAAGVVTVFGARDDAARIADEVDPTRVLEWLPEVQIDHDGNALWFDYVAETLDSVDRTAPWEPRRPSMAQRYLASIRYGNVDPVELGTHVLAGEVPDTRWCFHLVLDRGDHGDDDGVPGFARDITWPARSDAFVVTRDGIELRTYRRLRRIVCFHDLPALGDQPVPVSALELTYQDDGVGARLTIVRRVGYRGNAMRATQPLTVRYTPAGLEDAPRPVFADGGAAAGPGLSGRHAFVDLYGEGLPGLLYQGDRGWVYRANRGGGRFAEAVTVGARPSLAAIGVLGDLDRDGDPELAVMRGRHAGAFELDREEARWSGFRPFAALPHVEAAVGRTYWVDLNGDGRADVVVAHGDALVWFPSRSGALDEDGPEFEEPIRITRPDRDDAAPLCGPDGRLDLFFADMNGDGMPDLVRVGNGSVEYWPSLGNGRFGDRVAMDGAPILADVEAFDAGRVRLVDLQGTGAADLVYLGDGEIVHHANAGGRGFLPARRIAALPQLGSAGDVSITDLAGDGRPCLVWSSALPGRDHAVEYLPLVPDAPPGRLAAIDDGLGREVQLQWGSSAAHYLRDREAGTPWSTRLPQHRAVVDAKVAIDQIGGTRVTTRYRYRDGYFDGPVGALRGFGRVDVIDAETTSDDEVLGFAAPLLTRTWFHLGTPMWNHHRPYEPYEGDALAPRLPPHVGPALTLGVADSAEALRRLAGAVVRRERWAIDADDQLGPHPIDVAQQAMQVVCVQPRLGAIRPVFAVAPEEQITAIYEQAPDDPRVTHEVTVAIDAWGAPNRTASIAYPRRATAVVPEQARLRVAVTEHLRTNVDEPSHLLLGLPIATTAFELVGVAPDGDRITPARLRASDVGDALASPEPFDHILDPDADEPSARRLSWQRTYYWNDAGDDVLSLGQVGTRGRLHHTEDACFTSDLIEAVFDDRVSGSLLADLGYAVDVDVWWRAGVVQQYGVLGVVTGGVRGDGATTTLTYDDDRIAVVASTDSLGLETRFEPDYVTLQPLRATDPNGNVAELTYDPLGIAVRTSRRGACAGKQWGFEPRDDEPPPAVDLADLLADPEAYLGPAAAATWIDDGAWTRDGTPPVIVELTRTSLTHDGEGGDADGPIEMELTYLDGFGRPLQRKLAVTAGPAIARDGDGAVVVEDDVPVEEWTETRWRVSGHVAYDAKGQPGQVFEPFFSPSAAYEGDAVLQQFGVATLTRFDAAGRVVRVDLPNGTFATTAYTPWSSEQASAGDNVLDSTYRILREGLPTDDAERAAYEEARDHAGSTRVSFVDARGLACGTLERGDGETRDRHTVLRLDAVGRTTDVIDPRALVAFHHVHDMLGRGLLEASVDAGTRRSLSDGYDRPVRGWDARDFAVERGFDLADRPTHTHVRGGDSGHPLDHRVEELVYGDESSDRPGAIDANSLGRVVIVRDAGGERRTRYYDPAGGVRDGEIQPRSDADDTVDWSGSVTLEPDSLLLHTIHDALGRPVSEHLADGTWRRNLYVRGGDLASVQVSSPDGALTDTPVLASATRDAHGRPRTAVLGNDVALAWQYDRETGRLSQADAVRDSTVLQSLRYTHDPDGRMVRLLDLAQEGSGALVPGAVTARRDFGYDGHGRLIRATGRVHQALLQHDYIPGTGGTLKGTRHLSLDNGDALERYTQTFEYDDSGNLLALRHAGDTQSWATELWVDSASNRAAPALDPNGNPVTDPAAQFDAAGNTIQLAHLRSMTWSWRGCLERAVTVERSGGPVDDDETYGYGAGGQRARKRATRLVVGGSSPVVETRDVVYLGDQERVQVRRNGTLVLERWTTHVSDGERRIAIVDRHTVDTLAAEVDTVDVARIRYQLSTHQGSTALELDADGLLISYEEYFPHGGTAFLAGDDAREVARRDVRYCGKTRDDATGLYAYPYRYYAPWLGRWLSPDPIGPADDLNLYQFVLGDPATNVDDLGLDTRKPGSVVYDYERPVPQVDDSGRALTVDQQSDWYRHHRSDRQVSRFNSLSSDDQARFLAGGYALVVNADPASTAIAPAIIPNEQFEQSWVPARAAAAAARGHHLVIGLPTDNPVGIDGGRTSQAITTKANDGDDVKKDDSPAAAAAATAKTDGDGTDDVGTKDDRGTGEGKTGTGTRGGKGTGTSTGTGGDGTGGEGTGTGLVLTGSGPADIDAISGGFGGVRGGQDDGVVGGTPWSRGHTTGGTGTAIELAPLFGAGGQRGGGLGGSAGDAVGRGDTHGAWDAPRQGTSTMGHDPREIPPPGADVRRATAWDVLNDVSAITNFSSREGSPTGDRGGVPGGGGWFGWKGRVAQVVVATLSIVNFALLITGLPELIVGIASLLERLPSFLRALPRFIRNLPEFLRELPYAFRSGLDRLGGGLRDAWEGLSERLRNALRPAPRATPALGDGTTQMAPTLYQDVDDFSVFAKVAVADTENGVLNIAVHGDKSAFWVLKDGEWVKVSHRSLATWIQKQGIRYSTIRLLSCEVGSCPVGPAQNLANKLGRWVYAATHNVMVDGDGKYWIANGGTWELFVPGRFL